MLLLHRKGEHVAGIVLDCKMVHAQDRVCEEIIYNTKASCIERDFVYLLAYHAFVDTVLDSIHFNL